MSAPEKSNSKSPPSLLSDVQHPAGGARSARILADLEGRVASVAEAPRRSKAPLAAVIAVAAVGTIAAGAWGIRNWQGAGEHLVVVAATEPARQAASSVAVPAMASAVAAPRTATIVNDDNVAKSDNAPGADGDRLSRALANGAVDEPGSAAAVATAKAAVTKEPAQDSTRLAAKPARAETKADAARKQRAHEVELAQKRKHPGTSAHQASTRDDSDADLLAVLVARTRPGDAKQQAAERQVSAKTPGDAGLAARVKDCSTRGFFGDQLCRWRVCDGHWGKDPACPAAQKEPQQP